ncbi:hypothetical protein SLEP1_g43301 [Rubroshorea leprosula]|uniref:Uncharacterized protein n=1 Tax=Rubroshorea leprosula TaxID=152421 RepID=A0AAV5LCJ3_9ROSI|nr:hypothetical protein SLEP1_g43301 [Rubroshorea leprosula]
MSRPMLLAFLLLILVITSQFEWRQQLVDIDPAPSITQRQQQMSKREEAVKEKIILLQEKNIRRLNDLVQSLQQQLLQCKTAKTNNKTTNATINHLAEQVIELEQQQILEGLD